MDVFNYPIDCEKILRKHRVIRKELIKKSDLIEKRIAILSGSTIGYIKNILELFLLNQGIKPVFLEGKYNRYYEDAMFDEELYKFNPDVIYIHTSNKNIDYFPEINDDEKKISHKLDDVFKKYNSIWKRIKEKSAAIIIQNNFELYPYRILGNMDCSDVHGKNNFINRLNSKFYDYAQKNEGFYINDLNYLSSYYGINRWYDPAAWYSYKYCLNIECIPYLCNSITNIIKAVFGKNKKSLILDLDNTIWGGEVGEVGSDGIEIGKETPLGMSFLEFQKYIRQLKDMGIVLNICSKNDINNTIEGLKNSNCVLNYDDFICVKSDWNNKAENIMQIIKELNIMPDSFVFLDDNPIEREIVHKYIPDITIPKLINPEEFLNILDKGGYFETIKISSDDIKRSEFYKANILREKQKNNYVDFEDYLKSLKMKCTINTFNENNIKRVFQLINKTNQFNLTAKRYTMQQIQDIINIDCYILKMSIKLEDKFGDNGIVSVVIGEKINNTLKIDLWVMSCRVFKRNLELSVFDQIVFKCRKIGIKYIEGIYFETKKNIYVKNFYRDLGFNKSENEECWKYKIPEEYKIKNNVMEVFIDE